MDWLNNGGVDGQVNICMDKWLIILMGVWLEGLTESEGVMAK